MDLHVFVIIDTLSKSAIAIRDLANKWPFPRVDP
jgi:hypothetical protein